MSQNANGKYRMNRLAKTAAYTTLVKDIADLYHHAHQTLVESYWQIGRRIVEHEQQGDGKAEYGVQLLEHLSDDLQHELGRGFSVRNLRKMRRFYLNQRIQQPAAELNWSQHVELLPVTVHTITTNTHDTWSTSSTCLTVRTPKRSMRKAYTSINNFWIRDLHENGSRDIEFGIFDLTGPLALHRLRSGRRLWPL